MDPDKINSVTKGIFLLILAVAGNFVAETLGCKTQKLLSENMYSKHLIILLILYFSIGFVNSEKPLDPKETFQLALSIYVLFILFTKMSLTFTIIVFCLLAYIYINSTYIDYYKKSNPKKNKNEIEKLQNINKLGYIWISILIIIGFGLYFKKQYTEHYEDWNTMKFIFGVNKCDSMN